MRKLILCFICIITVSSSLAEEVKKNLAGVLKETNDKIFSTLMSSPGQFGKSCAAILSGDKIYDEHQVLSSNYRVEQYYNWACQSDFSSAADMKDAGLKLNIPLEGMPIPLGLDAVLSSSNFKESLTQWCRTAWSTLSDQAIREEFSRVISDRMVSAYKSCIDAEKETILKSYGVFAYVIPQDQDLKKFIINIEFRALDFSQPTIETIEGSDIKCTLGGKELVVPYKVKSTTLALTCTKPTDDSRYISFNTRELGASPAVRLPGLTDGVLKDLDQRTKGLAQLIIQERSMNSSELQKVNGRFGKLRFNKDACLVVETCGAGVPPCPAGFMDTGMTISNTWPHGGCGAGTVCRLCYTVDP